jgi:ribokinase
VSAATILCFGSVNIDITATSRTLPRPGETIHAERYAIGLGGKGANQAAAAARLAAGSGTRVEFAGRVGQDAFGAQARAGLEAFGVGLAGLAVDAQNPTGIALIGVDARGENVITVVGGCNMAVDDTDIDRIGSLLDSAGVLLLQLEIPRQVTLAAAARAKRAGAFVVLDPAPVPAGGLPDSGPGAVDWGMVDLITPNESETEALIGIRPRTVDEAAQAAEHFLARGLRSVVVKLGANGVCYRDRAGGGFVAPFRVQAIDSVAAGDCFNAGLAIAIARGDSLAEAVRFAAACGALATTRAGAAAAAPTMTEARALLERG